MEVFYPQWITEVEQLFSDLSSVPPDRPDLHIPLITRVLSHYADYYDHLIPLADRDIFQALSGYWLTPTERSFSWLGGTRPAALFHFVPQLDIDQAQSAEIARMKQQAVRKEKEIQGAMREVDDTMTALLAVTAMHGEPLNGEARAEAETRVVEIMYALFREADRLRRHVMRSLLEVLNSTQTVRFLYMVTNHQLLTRQFGLHLMARV